MQIRLSVGLYGLFEYKAAIDVEDITRGQSEDNST